MNRKRARKSSEFNNDDEKISEEEKAPVLSVEAIKKLAQEDMRRRTEAKVVALHEKSPSSAAKRKGSRRSSSSSTTAAAAASTPSPPPTTTSCYLDMLDVTTATTTTTPAPPSNVTFPANPNNQSRYFQSFILDCDGVLWHGDHAIEGSALALHDLANRANTKLHFVTNSSNSNRVTLANKLSRLLNLPNIDPDLHITTSGSACAQFIRRTFPLARTAFVIGDQGLLDELNKCGITGVQDLQPPHIPVDVVVCGLDTNFHYTRLLLASNYLQHCGILIATNMDAYDMLPHNEGTAPGAGCMVEALLKSLPKPPAFFYLSGKPNGEVLKEIMLQRGMEVQSTVVIGDRLDTDIEFARNAGVASCLVLTGVTKTPSSLPTFVSNSLHSFVMM